ncbi:MAG TPA: antibiotic biosynthesis monooxygenase [Pyrinomonadaceae bacterium]|nr:antibiotic biosynthesis monooxygenase [Pyrinomonadaceae bacterium]
MFTILYRWRIKPEKERQFIESWSEVTANYRENFNSLGSRLHRGEDGIFYSYAQWHSAEQRKKAFENIPNLPGMEKMREAVEESFPEIRLEIVSDYLILPEN